MASDPLTARRQAVLGALTSSTRPAFPNPIKPIKKAIVGAAKEINKEIAYGSHPDNTRKVRETRERMDAQRRAAAQRVKDQLSGKVRRGPR